MQTKSNCPVSQLLIFINKVKDLKRATNLKNGLINYKLPSQTKAIMELYRFSRTPPATLPVMNTGFFILGIKGSIQNQKEFSND